MSIFFSNATTLITFGLLVVAMSSGFVSGGTSDQPIKRNEEWLKVQQDVEAKRRQKLDEGKQDGGKSLYEVLQQNKGESCLFALEPTVVL